MTDERRVFACRGSKPATPTPEEQKMIDEFAEFLQARADKKTEESAD